MKVFFRRFCTPLDAYVPIKLSNRRTRFGFPRVGKSEDLEGIIRKTSGYQIGARKLFITKSRFKRGSFRKEASVKKKSAMHKEKGRAIWVRKDASFADMVRRTTPRFPLEETQQQVMGPQATREYTSPEEVSDVWLRRSLVARLIDAQQLRYIHQNLLSYGVPNC